MIIYSRWAYVRDRLPARPQPLALFAGIALYAVLVLLAAHIAFGAPPPGGGNPEWHDWFERQHNLRGGWCCNEADGHVLADEDWRTGPRGYEVRLDGRWLDVPPLQLRADPADPNPTGHAVVWYLLIDGSYQVFCFAPGTVS